MPDPSNLRRVSVVIPAYNEAQTVAATVRAAWAAGPLEVLVVSDGSTDDTAAEARRAGAEVLELQPNRGKAGALLAGVAATSGEIVLLLDADLIGVRAEHLHALAGPVISGEAAATVGLFVAGAAHTTLASWLTRRWSGQRAMKRELLTELDAAGQRYAIELMIEDRLKRSDIRPKYVLLRGVGHRTKEDKLGLAAGLRARLEMFQQLAAYRLRRRR
ncbi:glycosyltransferase [Deinococcus psychrotolerans]|uniref:Glycosyltransferase n=1 Tax=Deinococcus psychrotolerans TaxID=2489213 RepID=A0A3G8YBL7_9DEIO|nr:glycosyltransferase [Deinococcus psychrotolerans]AZI42320.1 glycosyltransferase [Deinococcus psychrotolerans]